MKGSGKRKSERTRGAPAATRDKTAGDGTDTWSPGLHDDAKAALLGRILAALPHADVLLAEAVAGQVVSDTARLILRDVHDERARLDLLRALAGDRHPPADLDAMLADHAALRRAGRAYGRGLWSTDRSGRTRLAAPGAAATYLAPRAVKAADLEAVLARLANHLDRLSRAARGAPKAEKAAAAGPAKRTPERARPKRPAPIGEPGMRQPRGPVRPARAPTALEPAEAAAPPAAE